MSWIRERESKSGIKIAKKRMVARQGRQVWRYGRKRGFMSVSASNGSSGQRPSTAGSQRSKAAPLTFSPTFNPSSTYFAARSRHHAHCSCVMR